MWFGCVACLEEPDKYTCSQSYRVPFWLVLNWQQPGNHLALILWCLTWLCLLGFRVTTETNLWPRLRGKLSSLKWEKCQKCEQFYSTGSTLTPRSTAKWKDDELSPGIYDSLLPDWGHNVTSLLLPLSPRLHLNYKPKETTSSLSCFCGVLLSQQEESNQYTMPPFPTIVSIHKSLGFHFIINQFQETCLRLYV